MAGLEAAAELNLQGDERQILCEGDNGLERVWTNFIDITKIPRDSGQEGEAIRFILKDVYELQQTGKIIDWEVDRELNVLVTIPATPGYENAQGIAFQGHLDMVCLGNPNPATNGVKLFLVEENGKYYVKAYGTTLGADNGVGVSMMMSLMKEDNPHGPLAFIFTNREETGLDGANGMSFRNNLQDYQLLFNVDSEEDGEGVIGSAGGGNTVIGLPANYRTADAGSVKLVTIKFENFLGGHSAGYIHKGRMNAIKEIGALLSDLEINAGEGNFALVSINGGEKGNSIPQAAEITIACNPRAIDNIRNKSEEFFQNIREQAIPDEKGSMTIAIYETESEDGQPVQVMDEETRIRLVGLIRDIPNGLFEMSEYEDVPETSSNLGLIRTEGRVIKLNAMTRSAVMDKLEKKRAEIAAVAEKYGADSDIQEPYEPWIPNPDNPINSIAKDVWKESTGNDLKLMKTHGGLELKTILDKYPHFQAISIGPQIDYAHSIAERVEVESVKRNYRFLRHLLEYTTQRLELEG